MDDKERVYRAVPMITFTEQTEEPQQEISEEQQVITPLRKDMTTRDGITFQRCGGGRRIIRKQSGGGAY
jgi:hypothetical protein